MKQSLMQKLAGIAIVGTFVGLTAMASASDTVGNASEFRALSQVGAVAPMTDEELNTVEGSYYYGYYLQRSFFNIGQTSWSFSGWQLIQDCICAVYKPAYPAPTWMPYNSASGTLIGLDQRSWNIIARGGLY